MAEGQDEGNAVTQPIAQPAPPALGHRRPHRLRQQWNWSVPLTPDEVAGMLRDMRARQARRAKVATTFPGLDGQPRYVLWWPAA
jgi:hypothetical protein